MNDKEKAEQAPVSAEAAPVKKKKTQSPGVLALQKVVNDVYQAARDAKKEGKLVGWSSSKFPCEIAETFDLNVVYPENQAAGIAAHHDDTRLCTIAENEGYDADICSYARINLAYAMGNETTNEGRRMPMPDFVLCCNNICNCMTKWYENIARIHNIPLIMVDIPYSNYPEVDDDFVAYVRGQFDIAIKQLEELTGKKFDEEKFKRVCGYANRTANAWLKVCDYLQYKPSPMSGFDLFNHMADVVTARGKKETAEAFELLASELEENLKTGKSTLPFPEQHRIMMEGIPPWPHLRELFKPLKEHGLNVTAVVYAPAFAFRFNDVEGMARSYAVAPNSVCLEKGVDWRSQLCKDNKVDGALVHYNRACKAWSGYMPEMQRRWQNELGIPVVGYDGDQADSRNFNAAQYETRVQALVEAMEEADRKKESGK
ncbi:2-hydroxyglutaryl-CoA dehydratase, D-component [Caprobacter fermentans]|uniref:2-hydroxyacyl-CoA dehydratase n=1 Tax=Caproicibacter fermentans TaxID=2576756 RepID=A0A6N8I345_9FIRM|nr:2-hydroxyacyl-CoA dehydratase [Caproicibacter fermentans]MVB12368.1 2-hydroxyglutaryl-CoA dehydratase, D-component [Caproicibacter fermentans]OCN03063.1 2-hydroxyglutaryl-CoA dehydratase [Clostridium sp. W14A]QNK40602.1 2-hydroxyacyl-CoA dehydratase [Caproicibacter fermentans]